MTSHEVLTSLFWLVAVGYVLFVAWFGWSWVQQVRAARRSGRLDRRGIGAE